MRILDEVLLSPVSEVSIKIINPPGIIPEEILLGQSDLAGRIDLPDTLSPFSVLEFKHPNYQDQRIGLEQVASQANQIFLKEAIYSLNDVVLSASKYQNQSEEIPQQIQVIKAQEIQFQNPLTSAELLEQGGQVFVQRSQQGGGSPNLRGFEANKVLLVIDGVRMNNAIYRSGHLQNVITIDPEIIERTEVLFGPSSTIYGSDALGGVMHFYTKSPTLSSTGQVKVSGNGSIRFGSASRSFNVHGDVSVGGAKWGSLSSLSFSSFGDLRVGENYPEVYPAGFGERDSFVVVLPDRDTIVANPDVYQMTPSGYEQWDFLQKILFVPNDRLSHTLNIQVSNSSNVPRFDRLTRLRNGRLRHAEWYYGPQLRIMGTYQLKHQETRIYDQLTVTAAIQHIEESRHTRDFQSPNLENRLERVRVYSVNADARKSLFKEALILGYGLEYAGNQVLSDAFLSSPNFPEDRPLDTRYPDGGTYMGSAAAYATLEYRPKHDWTLVGGFRFTDVILNSSIVDNSFYEFPFTSIHQHHAALSGNLGITYHGQPWKIAAQFATGFRAPNLDDVAKIFDSGDAVIVVPNPDLTPEYTYNFEVTVGRTFAEKVGLEATGFYTIYDQAIILQPTTFNGQDSILYQGVLSEVKANTNAQQAFIAGANFHAFWHITGRWDLFQTVTYTAGSITSLGDDPLESVIPMDHIPPVFGRFGLKYHAKGFEGSCSVAYQGWKRVENYSERDLDNIEYATPAGSPAWWTLNLKASYAVSSFLNVQAGVENLLDRHYRVHSSRISAPGRNIYLTLRGHF
ncbi:TonB-dependent receptor [Pontibacter sp. G13]|uniref:TonB-dependent receptor n=1 Tax=Pontibacter sp. G13 TaxID=3074898 RepID=UPI00288A4CEB|nr:TonB-dependent receptor [Pontibacter sp. G13]WNJ15972.1 TonB-dependent receptor [Pontibacter sp. G13]